MRLLDGRPGAAGQGAAREQGGAHLLGDGGGQVGGGAVDRAREEGAAAAALGPVDADGAAVGVDGAGGIADQERVAPVGLHQDVGHARQGNGQGAGVDGVVAGVLGADVDDGQAAAGLAGEAQGGQLEVVGRQQVRLSLHGEQAVGRAAQALQEGAHDDRLLRLGQAAGGAVGLAGDPHRDPGVAVLPREADGDRPFQVAVVPLVADGGGIVVGRLHVQRPDDLVPA